MTLPAKYVVPVFLLLVFVLPIFLGPLFYFLLAPLHLPFHRVMSRALLASALLALFLFRHRLDLSKWWPRTPTLWRQVGFGLILALVSAQTMIALDYALPGYHVVRITVEKVAIRSSIALVAALLVPPLEETIFRGFILSHLAETLGRRVGWILSAALFTVAHFLRFSSSHEAPAPIHWWSGAAALGSMFTHLGQGEILGGRGLNLFIAGLILGGLFLRAGNLWINEGLHAGWIFVLVTFASLVRPAPHPRVAFLGGDLIGTPIATAILLLLGVWLWFFYRPAAAAPEPVPSPDSSDL